MATTFYKLNSPNDVLSTDIVVIVETSNSLACRTDARSTSSGEANLPKGDSVSITTLANGVKTIEIDETTQDYLLVKVVKNGTYFNFYPYNDTNLEYELGCNTTNTNLRWKSARGTSYKYDWSIYEYAQYNNNSFSITTTASTSPVKVMGYYHSTSAGETFRVNAAPSSGFTNQKVELFVNRVVLPKLEAPEITSISNAIYTEDSIDIRITNYNSGGDIYYTTDGTTPTTSSTLYTGEFTINRPADPGTGYTKSDVTITAKCFASGYEDSDEASTTESFYYVRNIADMWNTSSYFVIQGIITYVDSNNHLFFIEDSTGGIRYNVTTIYTFNNFSQYIVLGNEIKVWAQITSGSSTKNYINKDLNSDRFKLISTGNTLPLATTTISSITAGNTTSTRVKLQDIVMLNTSGNTTGIYDNDDDSMMYIYNMPAKQGLKVGDNVDVIGVVYSNTNLNVQSANDITINQAPTPTGGGTLVQYQVSGTTVNLDGLVVIQTNKLIISQVTGGTLVAPQTKFFESGDTVVVTAIPDDGYQLDYFSPSGEASHNYSGNTCTLTFGNTDITIGATFVAS
jgi:hypothetical protein